jgi:hypothetical protein
MDGMKAPVSVSSSLLISSKLVAFGSKWYSDVVFEDEVPRIIIKSVTGIRQASRFSYNIYFFFTYMPLILKLVVHALYPISRAISSHFQ